MPGLPTIPTQLMTLMDYSLRRFLNLGCPAMHSDGLYPGKCFIWITDDKIIEDSDLAMNVLTARA